MSVQRTHEPWDRLREEFEMDVARRPGGKLVHLMQLRVGISQDEASDLWRPLVETKLGHIDGMNWFNSLPREGKARGPLHCFYGKADEITYDLLQAAHEMVSSRSVAAVFGTDNFALLLYFLAWNRPELITYQIHQFAFGPDDMPMDLRPFDTWQTFVRWESKTDGLPCGRYFCSLNRDVRLCAIDALRDLPALFLLGSAARRDTECESGDAAKKKVKWNSWALGHDGVNWRLFNRIRDAWRDQGILDIPRGNPGRIAMVLLEKGGSITSKEAIDLLWEAGILHGFHLVDRADHMDNTQKRRAQEGLQFLGRVVSPAVRDATREKFRTWPGLIKRMGPLPGQGDPERTQRIVDKWYQKK